MTPFFVCLAALAPLFALAYSDSSPVIAWSPQRSKTLDSFPSAVTKQDYFQSILETILFDVDVCRHDAVILVDHPGLKASHLRRLERSSPLVRRIAGASSSIQFPYARSSISDPPFDDLADAISRRCRSQLVKMQPKDGIKNSPGNKYVVSVGLNSVDSPGIFTDFMEKMTSAFPDHLIVYSSDSSGFVRRQLEDSPTSLFSVADRALAGGGILKRYQLLTPGLILTLIMVFFVFLPIIVLGINVLAGIQSPLRAEAPRSFSAKDKKNQ